MNPLLQRLASQARGNSTQPASRVRPVADMHAQLPLSAAEPVLETFTIPGPGPGAPQPEHARPGVAIAATRPVEAADSASVAPLTGRRVPDLLPPVARSLPDENAPHRSDTVKPASPRTTSDIQPPAALLDDLPAASSPLPMPSAIVKSAPPVSPEPARAQATHVHVHIGRIEVIAGADAPVPRKVRAEARKTTPLSEYLARRRQP